MPATKDIDTIASKVVKGDYIRMITGSRDYAMLVDTVKIGVKWTEARDAEGKLIFRRLNDEQTWAMRSMPTQAELAAEKEENDRKVAAWHEEMLSKMLARMHGGLADAKDRMTAALAKGFMNTDVMEDIIIEQEYKTIACIIDQILEHNPEMTVKVAMEHAADRIKEGLINGNNEPTQSGGFSFGNAARQTRIAARRKFLQGIAWGTLS